MPVEIVEVSQTHPLGFSTLTYNTHIEDLSNAAAHIGSGVDGTGTIRKKEPRQRFWFMRIGMEPHLSHYTIEKGSIAVDGISLTINSCQNRYFEVNIIPETAKQTTILRKKAGDLVNIETDLIAKYVEKFLLKERFAETEKRSSVIDQKMLNRYGFGD